jgi:outer membrane protein OmpA-like peptidoglycan-associated protein
LGTDRVGGFRALCVLVSAALAITACANGRPKPAACAAVGAVAGAGTGLAIGQEVLDYDYGEWRQVSYTAGGAIVLGTAGYLICRAMAGEQAAPPPPSPPAPAPPASEPIPAPPLEPPVAEKIILRGVNFDFDKDGIRPDAAVILDEAARILTSSHPGARVRIEGHADSTGPEAYNQGLSERRANSVRGHLVSQGVEASRLTTVGYGESRPIADNATREGRALNRRVELQVEE